ncbi:hypothetical protein GPECTOR_75g762 [Gonium pectorale]|uniref:Uncharacterized protein n=1 Tax=Gonium pectorale TaxID=33097 RepID=A0A150G2H1_GONPE|nr:hypothetical protein GPECTOR_75g762 [Gonium pectorale]|eukprot:KXZ44038.1 hypothetical protein GPECTOR_75g762 [Gonium pectorale]
MALKPSRGDVVLVTGCSDGGIGAGLCRAFHAAGCYVFATARRLESMAGLQALGIRTLSLDVTSAESIKEAVDAVVAEAGRIDVLVNNAGIGLVAPLAEVDMTKAQERGGVIANIGSVVALVPTPWGGIYCASKAAIHNLTETLRLELAPFGIRVVLVAPGAVQSNIGANNLRRFDETFKLYGPWTGDIRARALVSQGKESMPTDVFARGVVRQLLRRTPPRVFLLGGMVGMIRFALRLPLWLRDRMVSRKFGLNRKLPIPAAAPVQPGAAKAD